MKYLKKCEEFYICGSKNKKKEIFAESGDKSLTLFQIIVKGKGRLITTFDSMFIDGTAGDIVDFLPFGDEDNSITGLTIASITSNLVTFTAAHGVTTLGTLEPTVYTSASADHKFYFVKILHSYRKCN